MTGYLAPCFHLAGEKYILLVCIAVFSIIIAAGKPMVIRDDGLFVLLLGYVFMNSWLHDSIQTPLTAWKWLAAAIAYLCGRCFCGKHSLIAGVLVIPALLQSIVVLLQALSLLPSLSFFFPVSGTFGNPAVPAVIIALGFTELLSIAHRRWAMLSFPIKLIIIVVGLLLSSTIVICNNRSCWFAVIVVVCIVFSRPYLRHARARLLILCGFFLVLWCLYLERPGSANVRFLIWRSSMYLFTDHPVFGGGSTSFAAEYMLGQASYFTHHPDSPLVMLANEHNQPYNELMRLLCEQGLLGTILFAAALLTRMKSSVICPLGLVTFITISFFYNPSDVIILFLLFWLLVGSLDVRPLTSKKKNTMRFLWPVTFAGVALACVFCAFNEEYMDSSRWESNYPSYHGVCKKGDDYVKQERYEEAETCYKLACAMIPCRITAPYRLYKLYEVQNSVKALEWGDHILNEMQFSITSGQTLQMKADIRDGMRRLRCEAMRE